MNEEINVCNYVYTNQSMVILAYRKLCYKRGIETKYIGKYVTFEYKSKSKNQVDMLDPIYLIVIKLQTNRIIILSYCVYINQSMVIIAC